MMVLSFCAPSFQTIQVFFNGKYNYHPHILCRKLIVTKDKHPLSLLARHEVCFVSHRINSFRLDLPLLCDLNIKPIIFSAIVRNPHRCFSHSPSSSNLRQFGDNYSLLEEMWLAVSVASWVGKTRRIFPFSLGRQNAGLCG